MDGEIGTVLRYLACLFLIIWKERRSVPNSSWPDSMPDGILRVWPSATNLTVKGRVTRAVDQDFWWANCLKLRAGKTCGIFSVVQSHVSSAKRPTIG
jgi:hypothetical protein